MSSRRWPLHPAPSAGEALSSWLTRLAHLYGMSVTELLRYSLDAPAEIRTPGDLARLDTVLDVDPPGWVLSALQERTGVDQQTLRRMTITGWVPWLLDDINPDEGTEAFRTYVRQASVLLPLRRSPVGQAANWRPWLAVCITGAGLMSRACRSCVADPDRGMMLMAKIPLMLTCPEHGCRLAEVLGHPVQHLFWLPPREHPAEPVTEAVLAMDRFTHEGLSTGQVCLPRRSVHVGVWLRLLRILLDEVAMSSTRLGPSHTRHLERIWSITGHRFRGGLTTWKPYEMLDWPTQKAMLEAAATALHLIIDGQIQARGTLGQLLRPEPDAAVFVSNPPRSDRWNIAMAQISAAVEAARFDAAFAQELVTALSERGHGRWGYERIRKLVIDVGVPDDLIPTFDQHGCDFYESDAETDDALRSR